MSAVDLDGYIVDTLMPDRVGHDRPPSASLVYLLLWRLTHRPDATGRRPHVDGGE